MDEVVLVGSGEVYGALQELNDTQSAVDWVLLEYDGQKTNHIKLAKKGSGGIEEFKKELRSDAVQYGVVQVLINADEYNPIKNSLIAWIGSDVKAGLLKARAAGQRVSLFNLLTIKNGGIPIASQFAADKLSDVTPDNIAHSITRISSAYGTAKKVTQERQGLSKGGSTTQQLTIVDKDNVIQALKGVHTQQHDWAILSYVKGQKSEIELIATGSGGVEALKGHWPEDRIFYCIVRLAAEQEKIVLLTLIGKDVKPMEKARSGTQRHEASNFVLSIIPLHGEYQPNDPSDLHSKTILSKFK